MKIRVDNGKYYLALGILNRAMQQHALEWKRGRRRTFDKGRYGRLKAAYRNRQRQSRL